MLRLNHTVHVMPSEAPGTRLESSTDPAAWTVARPSPLRSACRALARPTTQKGEPFLGLHRAPATPGDGQCQRDSEASPDALDPKTLALVRLAALIAVGGAVPSYGAQVDAAIDAGATADEIVDVLVGVIPIVGLPSVVDAAPKLAMALGYDTDAAL